MASIEQGVQQFRSRLQTDRTLTGDELCCKVIEQIDKYSNKLFADPIEVNTSSGSMTIYPQRTNNMLEQFFRNLRRGHRRKRGNNSMRRVLQAMLADDTEAPAGHSPNMLGLCPAGAIFKAFDDLFILCSTFSVKKEVPILHVIGGYGQLPVKQKTGQPSPDTPGKTDGA